MEIKKDSKYKSQIDYARKSVKQIKLGLVRTTDADIIEKLESVKNVSKYLKDLIRADMKK